MALGFEAFVELFDRLARSRVLLERLARDAPPACSIELDYDALVAAPLVALRAVVQHVNRTRTAALDAWLSADVDVVADELARVAAQRRADSVDALAQSIVNW